MAFVDVGNWKEGGGRGVMQQSSPSKDAQSSPVSGVENLTEIQLNGPPTSIGSGVPGEGSGVTSPMQPGGAPGLPMRPAGMQGPGGPMHMGPPPYSMPPGYRGMMPPYVSKTN